MEIHAIANQKGGVGKTSVTLGLAAQLGRSNVRTLVVDLDPQASATKVLGIDVDERPTLADALLEPDRFPLRECLAETAWHFDLAPAETALASRETRRATADEFILRRQLERVESYDVVLIDCPPSLGVLTLNALAAASRLLLVTEPTYLALQGIGELLDTYELVRTHYNATLSLEGVIVNRWERTVEHRNSSAEIEQYFGSDLTWRPFVPKRTALQDATRRGVPVGRLPGPVCRELVDTFARLAARIGGAPWGPVSRGARLASAKSSVHIPLAPRRPRETKAVPAPTGWILAKRP